MKVLAKNEIPMIRQASREMVRELGLLSGKHQQIDLTYSEGHALLEVKKHKLMTVIELARILCLDKSTASRVVYKLIKRDLLTYSENPLDDRRQKPLELTSLGEEMIVQVNTISDSHVSRALTNLNSEQRKTVVEGLTLYAKALARARQQKEFEIRPIQKEDNAAIAAIIRRVLAEFNFSGPGTAAADPEVDSMTETYSRKKSAYFVAVKGEKVVGGVGFAPLEGVDGVCELQKMYLLPEARGVGLGEKLLQKCLQKAKIKKFKQCYLETAFAMKKAQTLYKKLGFHPIDGPMGNTGHFRCECWYLKDL